MQSVQSASRRQVIQGNQINRANRSRHVRRWWPALALALVVLLFAGCSSTAGSNTTNGTGNTPGGSSTVTPSGTPNPSDTGSSGSGTTSSPTAPQHAFAWTQYDNASTPTPQIWASINGGTPHQITHLPPITNGCDTQIAWGLPVFSPDLAHIVASIGSPQCGDGNLVGPVDIIDATSGAITTVPGGANSYDASSVRSAGWVNANTIFFVSSTNGSIYTYTMGGSPATLPGISNAYEAVIRGSTLFWSQATYSTGTNNWTVSLHRYDMNAHSAIGGSISLGQVHQNCHCSPGDYYLQGWDASPDGSHVVYHVTTPNSGSTNGEQGIASSHIYYANADGSGASQIASYMSTNQPIRMSISPNGQLVAFTDAFPTPSVITASVSSPGNNGDPNFHAYTPDAGGYPVWKWDSSSFWAANRENGDFESPGTKAIYYHVVGSTSALIGVNGGFNPWYTIA